MDPGKNLRISFLGPLVSGIAIVLDPRCEAWAVEYPHGDNYAESLSWTIIRHSGSEWMIRFREGFEVQHNEEGEGCFETEELKTRCAMINDGWEFPLRGQSTVVIKTLGYTLHLRLEWEGEDFLRPTRVLFS